MCQFTIFCLTYYSGIHSARKYTTFCSNIQVFHKNFYIYHIKTSFFRPKAIFSAPSCTIRPTMKYPYHRSFSRGDKNYQLSIFNYPCPSIYKSKNRVNLSPFLQKNVFFLKNVISALQIGSDKRKAVIRYAGFRPAAICRNLPACSKRSISENVAALKYPYHRSFSRGDKNLQLSIFNSRVPYRHSTVAVPSHAVTFSVPKTASQNINYQLSTIYYQLSIINCQLSIINCQLSPHPSII